MGWIAIAPPDRLGGLVVVADVATNLSRQVSDRGEDAARQQVPLDLRKPEFDLVEPRRIGRREVQMHVWVLQQEGADRLRLMGREIVSDHMNLSTFRLRGDDVAEKFDKRRAGMTRNRLPEHFAGFRVEGGEERQRAVAVILESVPL